MITAAIVTYANIAIKQFHAETVEVPVEDFPGGVEAFKNWMTWLSYGSEQEAGGI